MNMERITLGFNDLTHALTNYAIDNIDWPDTEEELDEFLERDWDEHNRYHDNP